MLGTALLPVSVLQLLLSLFWVAPAESWCLPWSGQSFSRSPLRNSLYYLYDLALSTITHFLCAGVNVTVVTSDSLQDYFTVSPQLLTMVSCLVRLPVHVLFFPLLNPCLYVCYNLYANNLSFTSFFAFLASSLFLAASSLSALASVFLRSIVWLLLLNDKMFY